MFLHARQRASGAGRRAPTFGTGFSSLSRAFGGGAMASVACQAWSGVPTYWLWSKERVTPRARRPARGIYHELLSLARP